MSKKLLAFAKLKICLSNESVPYELELSKPVLTLGRNRSCDIVLPCAKISRIHGTFVWRYIDDTNPFHQLIDGDYFGKMPSTNGIFVNGQHVDKIWERLNHKDLITLGEVKIVYLLLEPLENPTDSSKETYQNMKDAK